MRWVQQYDIPWLGTLDFISIKIGMSHANSNNRDDMCYQNPSYVALCICVIVRMFVCVYIFVYLYMCVCMRMYEYVLALARVCVCILVHKRMFYIRTNLRMLQHSNVECNIQMFVLCNKMMYFGDFVVLAA